MYSTLNYKLFKPDSLRNQLKDWILSRIPQDDIQNLEQEIELSNIWKNGKIYFKLITSQIHVFSNEINLPEINNWKNIDFLNWSWKIFKNYWKIPILITVEDLLLIKENISISDRCILLFFSYIIDKFNSFSGMKKTKRLTGFITEPTEILTDSSEGSICEVEISLDESIIQIHSPSRKHRLNLPKNKTEPRIGSQIHDFIKNDNPLSKTVPRGPKRPQTPQKTNQKVRKIPINKSSRKRRKKTSKKHKKTKINEFKLKFKNYLESQKSDSFKIRKLEQENLQLSINYEILEKNYARLQQENDRLLESVLKRESAPTSRLRNSNHVHNGHRKSINPFKKNNSNKHNSDDSNSNLSLGNLDHVKRKTSYDCEDELVQSSSTQPQQPTNYLSPTTNVVQGIKSPRKTSSKKKKAVVRIRLPGKRYIKVVVDEDTTSYQLKEDIISILIKNLPENEKIPQENQLRNTFLLIKENYIEPNFKIYPHLNLENVQFVFHNPEAIDEYSGINKDIIVPSESNSFTRAPDAIIQLLTDRIQVLGLEVEGLQTALAQVKGKRNGNSKLIVDTSKIEVNEKIAEIGGSFASVYSATIDGWVCALKELRNEDVGNQLDGQSGFLKEISFLESLPVHKNIVRYLYHDTTARRTRLFMQKYHGTLGEYLKNRKKQQFDNYLSPAELQKYLLDIASGLAFLHKHAVIHRGLYLIQLSKSKLLYF